MSVLPTTLSFLAYDWKPPDNYSWMEDRDLMNLIFDILYTMKVNVKAEWNMRESFQPESLIYLGYRLNGAYLTVAVTDVPITQMFFEVMASEMSGLINYRRFKQANISHVVQQDQGSMCQGIIYSEFYWDTFRPSAVWILSSLVYSSKQSFIYIRY